jgi:hypothetical protein
MNQVANIALISDSEDGGDMFLRNVGWLSPDYTTLYPRRYTFHYVVLISMSLIYGKSWIIKHITYMNSKEVQFVRT